MNMSIGAKLKLMRESERLTSRPEVARMLGIEENKTVPSTEVITNILNHPRFEKYALWFITGKIAPESGQIAPVLAHFGQDEITSQPSDQKIG